MTVYNAVVVPTLVYGCETWVLKDRDKTRLQAAEVKVLRSVVGVTRLECVRRERLKQEAVVAQVKRRRELWREKMLENEGSLVNRVTVRGIIKLPSTGVRTPIRQTVHTRTYARACTRM